MNLTRVRWPEAFAILVAATGPALLMAVDPLLRPLVPRLVGIAAAAGLAVIGSLEWQRRRRVARRRPVADVFR